MSSFKSARKKIARANKHLKSIQRCIADYAASRPYVVTKSKGKNTVQVSIRKPPPSEIALLAGEMVYQMRSALDHLIFDLIKSNPASYIIQSDWEEKCEFPIRKPLKGGKTPPRPQTEFLNLPGLSPKAFAFIESVQPYYVAHAEVNTALGILGKLSNIDKHRRLNIVSGRILKREYVRLSSGMTGSGVSMLDSGAKFPTKATGLKGDRAVYMNRRYSARIHFNERAGLGDAGTLPVDFLLKLILEQIKTVIVPTFDKFMSN